MNIGNLNESIYVLLVQKRVNKFSVGELKDAYMAEFNHYKSESEARKFIYRQVYKLVSSGYLIKKGKKHTKNIKYYQTELFKSDFCDGRSTVSQIKLNKIGSKLRLINKLVEYKGRLAVSIAEIEEYQQRTNQYPHLIERLKPKLDLAKHKRSQFIGKVMAIENILNSY
jgi:hypothetical protein